MIVVDLQAEVALGWDGPRFNWKCPLCDDGSNVADRCSTPGTALELALYHLETRHDIDYDLVRVSVEYWAIRMNGPITLEKVEKIDGE
jgi:hypothetical protein